MVLKKTIPIVLFLLIGGFAFGQTEVAGTVIDGDSGEALVGATVVFKNTSDGTGTDIDGSFE